MLRNLAILLPVAKFAKLKAFNFNDTKVLATVESHESDEMIPPDFTECHPTQSLSAQVFCACGAEQESWGCLDGGRYTLQEKETHETVSHSHTLHLLHILMYLSVTKVNCT